MPHRPNQVRSGQVRSGLHTKGGPVFGRKRKKLEYVPNYHLHAAKNRKTSQDVSSIKCCPKPHLSNIQDSHTGNTHSVLTSTCFVDGPHVEYQKDARNANVEPTDAQANWHQHCKIKEHTFGSPTSFVKLHHQRLSTLENAYCVTKACPFYIESASAKKVISPGACFGASHRAIHKGELN